MSSKATGRPGVFSPGERVEVLSSEEGFSDAWATATVVSQSKGALLVEYSKFVDGDGKQLREKVRWLFSHNSPSAALPGRAVCRASSNPLAAQMPAVAVQAPWP